LRRPRSRLH